MRPARAAPRLAVSTACAITALVLGCSSSPSTGTYTLSFQSVQEAIAVDTVTVLVFDASTADAASLCTDLLSRRASAQDLPAPLVELPAKTLCELRGGSGSFDAPFGNVAVLAIAQHAKVDFARGCATQHLDSGSTNVTIELSLAIDEPGLSVPATPCASLAQHCANACP